ncbi:MAG TPA: ScpA family protein [Stellaceae bacterium]|nr:ScpA family protein [Stellaceae bacterium]
MSNIEPFEPPVTPAELVVDLGAYEGPIDVLLMLAREQKVDLTQLSILDLADQYLAFIANARRLRLEIAADYLVMAAWLAYLKSRLLLPDPHPPDEPSASELAARLALQLQRLQAMQEAGTRLMARPILGRDVFARGTPEGLPKVLIPIWDVTLFDLLRAYGAGRGRKQGGVLQIEAVTLYSMDDALQRLSPFIGHLPEWRTLQSFLPEGLTDDIVHRSAIAATFAASLELAREGKLILRQDHLFGPLYLRSPPVP